jgi:hypothetical protein
MLPFAVLWMSVRARRRWDTTAIAPISLIFMVLIGRPTDPLSWIVYAAGAVALGLSSIYLWRNARNRLGLAAIHTVAGWSLVAFIAFVWYGGGLLSLKRSMEPRLSTFWAEAAVWMICWGVLAGCLQVMWLTRNVQSVADVPASGGEAASIPPARLSKSRFLLLSALVALLVPVIIALIQLLVFWAGRPGMRQAVKMLLGLTR